jgi:hypothetical protein
MEVIGKKECTAKRNAKEQRAYQGQHSTGRGENKTRTHAHAHTHTHTHTHTTDLLEASWNILLVLKAFRDGAVGYYRLPLDRIRNGYDRSFGTHGSSGESTLDLSCSQSMPCLGDYICETNDA